ncbi:MAG: HEAT repeat domain-containing protein [Methanobacterium sp.]
MKGEPDLYDRVSLNSDVTVCELEKYENESNFEIIESVSFNRCIICGKIIAPWEIYDHKYCKYCADVIKSTNNKPYGTCIKCNKPFPISQLYKLKYCPDCAGRIRTCECCNTEFVFEDENSFICPSCIDTLSKECIKCRKEFIPEGNYSYFCPSCYNEYQKNMEIQILENSSHDIELHKPHKESTDFHSLIKNLNGNNPIKRALALETVCNIKNKYALPVVISALKNKDTNIRWKAARYLGISRDKNAVKPLIEALKDKEFIVRNNAVWSLGEIGDKKAIKPLTLVLEDENKYVRCSVEEAVEKIRNN